jgi:hypothetical protein
MPQAPLAGMTLQKSPLSEKCAQPAAMNTGPSSANVLFHDSTKGKAAAAASNALTKASVLAKSAPKMPATIAAWELSGSVLTSDGLGSLHPSSPMPGSTSPEAIAGPMPGMLRLLAALIRAIEGVKRNEATCCDTSSSRNARRNMRLIIALSTESCVL